MKMTYLRLLLLLSPGAGTCFAGGLVTITGITEPIADVTLSASVPGIVSAWKFKEGDSVRQGDTIIELDKKLEELEGDRLIVDLNAQGYLEAALAWKARTNRPVIGFISHVAVDQIEQARQLGIDRILSNGGFSSSIESILKN